MGMAYSCDNICDYETPVSPVLPMPVKQSDCQGFSGRNCCERPPQHPRTPQAVRRGGRWRPFVRDLTTPPPRRHRYPSGLIEYAMDPLNPCDLCGGTDIPTKLVDFWVVCRNCMDR